MERHGGIPFSGQRRERLGEVGDEILGVLEPHRKTEKAVSGIALPRGALRGIELERGLQQIAGGQVEQQRPVVAERNRVMDHLEPLRQQFIARYEAHLADNTYAFDGIAQLIAALQARGISWGIITNKSIELTRALVSRMPLLQSAMAVVGGNSAAAPKPSAAPMLLAGKLAGVDITQCWYVGDDERDIQAARAAHMPCAIAAGWGYAPSSALHHWGADAVCSHPAQILDILASA